MNETAQSTVIIGSLRWTPADEGGPQFPPKRERLAAFAYVEPNDSPVRRCMLIDGIVPDAPVSEVQAWWQEPGPDSPVVAPGDVIVITGAARQLARLVVSEVR